MQKTTFRIEKMDCPSEEQLIRMKLEGLADIQSMEFDISRRLLHIYHSGGSDGIFKLLKSMKLDA